jgi:hypothetical protein
MRFEELIIDDKSIRSDKMITKILLEKGFYWLVDSEIESARRQLKISPLSLFKKHMIVDLQVRLSWTSIQLSRKQISVTRLTYL